MSNSVIRALEPVILWNNFSDINAIPRASKKEERIIRFMMDFGKNLGLETIVDPAGNVIIKKPATPGMDNRMTVVLQSHLDMVHQKNSDSDFDFESEGIKMMVEGDWVKAIGTTLGADNGLGVAAIMSVLESTDLVHPALEALFTIDEETGMTGAQELQPGYLDGEILLNLDTEEDDEIDIGCAGGIDLTASRSYKEVEPKSQTQGYTLSVTGLLGGHSGMDIHKGLGNANKIMNEILLNLHPVVQVIEIKGGSLRNAIPRESFAEVTISTAELTEVTDRFSEIAKTITQRFSEIEPELSIDLKETVNSKKVMDESDQLAVLQSLDGALNGVYLMSAEIPDLVEASNNIAKVTLRDGQVKVECLTRSSVETSKAELTKKLEENFGQSGFEVRLSGSYPGWSPNRNSPILKVLKRIYVEMFKTEPKVGACHAGLECGIIGSHYPNMDMISFGPTIKGAHSPDERASITSVKRFWSYLKVILANIPVKNS